MTSWYVPKLSVKIVKGILDFPRNIVSTDLYAATATFRRRWFVSSNFKCKASENSRVTDSLNHII